MHKMLLLLLLASAATTPALAQRGHRSDSDNNRPSESSQNDDSDNNAARAERQQAREEARAQRSEPAEASGGRERAFAVRANPEGGAGNNSSIEPRQHIQIQQQVASDQSGGDDSPRERRRASSGPKIVHPEAVSGGDSGVTFDGNRSRERARQRQVEQDAAVGQPGGTLRQSDRATPNVLRVRDRTPLVSETPRQGTQPPLRAERHRRDRPNWSTSWRHNNRYDWHNWRKRHRSLFRLGFYFDPFGWNYRPYSIGWRLWPSYYSSRYWLNDPWHYRLPYAPPGYRWIRYYNDAILVDTWNGEVVDVIYNFFW